MEAELTAARAVCYFGLAIPVIAFFVDRYALRRCGLTFALASVACYSTLLVALVITDSTGINDKSRGYFRDSSGHIEYFRGELVPLRAWQSPEGRALFPFYSLFLVPVWTLLVYGILWLLQQPLRLVMRLVLRLEASE